MINNFCDIHKNEIAVSRCTKCSRNICNRCSLKGSSFCPKCSRINIGKIEKKQSKNEIRNILMAGFISGLLCFLVNIFSDNALTIFQQDFIINCILFFFLGISFASAIYFINKTDTFDEINEIPFFGKKIMKYIIIISSFIGIPIMYFLYLIYQFFSKKV